MAAVPAPMHRRAARFAPTRLGQWLRAALTSCVAAGCAAALMPHAALAAQPPQTGAAKAPWGELANYALGFEVGQRLAQARKPLPFASVDAGAADAAAQRAPRFEAETLLNALGSLDIRIEGLSGPSPDAAAVAAVEPPEKAAEKPRAQPPAPAELWAYALGRWMGDTLFAQGVAVDARSLAAGLRAGQTGAAPAIGAENQRIAMSELRRHTAGLSPVEARRTNRLDDPARAFFDENARKPDVVALPSGLQYRVLRTGSGRAVHDGDRVVVRYRGYFLDGTPFTSNADSDAPPKEELVSRAFPGLREALQLMTEGSRIEAFMPAHLGPPPRRGNPIAGKALVYELELVEILATAATDEADVSARQ